VSVAALPSSSAEDVSVEVPANAGPAERAGDSVWELMAVGGLTLVLFPLAWLLRASLGLDEAELAVGFVMFHAAHFLNDPHFAVTYLLFYKDVRARALGSAWSALQRVRYVVAGLVVPAALVVWAGWALIARSAQALGFMAQLMFLLVGWHYAKQGFGVLTVLSARRGVRFAARERNVVLAHCYAAWAFAFANPSRAAGMFEEKGVVYWAPARPEWLELTSGAALALSTLALVFVLAAKWRREGSLAFTPLIGFLVTIWFWTIYTTIDPLVRYVIPALHSLQYIYFVWLMKRNEARASEALFGPPVRTRLAVLALSAVALGWAQFRGVPSLLDASVASTWASESAARSLGATPFFAAFFIVVNLHHYFMDNVIWRRDNPETRYLHGPASST
jgi:hypothetical protein